MALGVDASRECEPDEVHFRCCAEHERADFYGAYSTFQIQLSCKGDGRKMFCWNVRQECLCIEINRMSSGWLHDRNTLGRDVVPQIRCRGDAVTQVVFL